MGKIDFTLAVTPEALAEAALLLLRDRIRARRDRAVSAGIAVAGVTVHTDDLSQQRILGAAVAVMRDPSLVINWKTADGTFVPLDAEAVLAAADAVRAHVQACYDREAELLGALDAGGVIDPGAGWPG